MIDRKKVDFNFYKSNISFCKNFIRQSIEEEISKIYSDWIIDSLSISYPNNLFDWSVVRQVGIQYSFTYRSEHITIPNPSLGNFHLRHRERGYNGFYFCGRIENKLNEETLPNLIYETHTVSTKWKFDVDLSEMVSKMREEKISQLFS